MGRASKDKGGDWERAVSKSLSLWLSGSQRDDLIWRSSLSGGRATVAFKKGKEYRTQSGDLCSIDPISDPFLQTFYCECKSYNQLQIASCFLKEKGLLIDFWTTTRHKARLVSKLPMLIAKENFTPTFIMITERGKDRLGLGRSFAEPAAILPRLSAFVYLLDEFVNHAVPVRVSGVGVTNG